MEPRANDDHLLVVKAPCDSGSNSPATSTHTVDPRNSVDDRETSNAAFEQEQEKDGEREQGDYGEQSDGDDDSREPEQEPCR